MGFLEGVMNKEILKHNVECTPRGWNMFIKV